MLTKELTPLERCQNHLENTIGVGESEDRVQFDDEKFRVYVHDVDVFETIARTHYSEIKNIRVGTSLYAQIDIHNEGYEYDTWTVRLDEESAESFLAKYGDKYSNN